MKKKPTTESRKTAAQSMEQLLRQAMPAIGDQADSPPGLWPAIELGLHAHTPTSPTMPHVPWFDWALGCGLAALLVLCPAWIPVLLYCL